MKPTSEKKLNHPVEQKTQGPYKDVYATWLQLYRAISQSLANAEYDAVIDGSLQVLTNLDKFKVMILDAYASASAMKGRFDKAMQAAEEMIVRTPTKAGGYLRAGNTLTLQGKHKQAIQIYDRGLDKVPADDQQYAALKSRRALSYAQLTKRVDFLTSLPASIASIIIDQLDLADRDLECMKVSKKWHRMLADHASVWKDLILRPSSDGTIFRILPTIVKHTQVLGSLGLDRVKTQYISKAVLSEQLCNIQYFHMHRCDLDPQQLLLTLSHLGNTLTSLMLDVHKSSQGLPIDSILHACPKLEVLRYFIGEGEMEFGEPRVPGTVCQIKSLSLVASLVKTEVLDAVLRRCPQLQDLFVRLCPVDGLKLVTDHCPNLVSLGFNGIRPDLVSSPVDKFPGLRQVTIHQTAGMDPRHFIQILEKSPLALQAFVFSIYDEEPSITERWDRLTKIKFENLRHVSYCFANSMDMHAVIAKMIRNSRTLQSVSLRSLGNLTGTEFEDALLSLPDLAVLRLLVIPKVNVVGLKHFLTTHAGKGKASSLRKVHITQCDDFSDSLLEMLAAVETIEEFAMYSCKGPTTDGLVKFVKQISVNNTLDHLHLSDMDSVDDTVLDSIRNMRSLRYLGFVRLNNITVSAVEGLAVSMKNLKELNILGCSRMSMQAYHQILEKLDARSRLRALE